jgi:hypothetical protein
MGRWDGRERRKDSGNRLIIELPLGSNLDKVVKLFITTLGDGLQAIALALSTPQDNSRQVQRKIDQYSERISEQKQDLQDAINRQEGQ